MESPVQNGETDKVAMQNEAARQDGSPTGKRRSSGGSPKDPSEDPDATGNSESNLTIDSTLNSECDITVIHVADEKADLEKKEYGPEGKDSKDGSDSGVEGCAIEPPRVQSRNSVDYASSCNGLDEASCDSSLVSCCSVYEEACASLPGDLHLEAGRGAPGAGEGTSEGGSESSSVAGSTSARPQKRPGAAPGKKKPQPEQPKPGGPRTAKTASASSSSSGSAGHLVNGTTATGARAKPRAPAQRGAAANAANAGPRAQSLARDRGRPRDKSAAKDAPTGVRATSAARASLGGTTASRSRMRPDSLPSALTTELNKDLAQRGRPSTAKPRAGSTTRPHLTSTTTSTRTPGSTPSEDGRKSLSTVGRSSSLYGGRAEHLKSARFLDKMTTSLDGGSKVIEAYGTLPRAARHSKFSVPRAPERPPVQATRSRSGSRDASLNRLLGRKTVGKEAVAHKGLPPYPKQKPHEKTRIYHEISSQTGLTGKDIDNCLAGIATVVPNPESVEKSEKDSQTEGSWDDLQHVKNELKKATDLGDEKLKENDKLKAEVQELKKKLEEEQADHAFAKQELNRNAQRVLAMLGTPQSEHADGSDSFLELESHFQSSGQVVASQQVEIDDLQSLCRMLSRDLEKSLAAQKALLQQQQELEAESMEMQDFLQEEKATLEIALKESESESKKKDENVKQVSSELERQTEECKHLVRISEQRRQENLSLSMKLNAVERRSKELLLAQGAAVSGASVALSGLGSRLEGLVDQLIMSYHISGKDLEDVIYHNEAFSRSNSSVESSPVSSKHSIKDCTPSPKRGSFVSAVIGAIRNAATHPFATKQVTEKKSTDSSKAIRKDLSIESSSDILDFETEPCLMMESVLEDVPLPDTYSHNMVSSCDSLRRVLSVPESVDEHDLRFTKMNGESTSLTNLTQAILHRRKVEDEEEENYDSVSESETGPSEGLLPLTDYCPATSLVDQVIDVDNLVTKLLKVLRIIQLDNDTCIQELKDEKTELETRLDIFMAERKTADNSQELEKEILSNGVDHSSIIENCKHVIKEMNDVKELIVDGQMGMNKCISEESRGEEQNANATILCS